MGQYVIMCGQNQSTPARHQGDTSLVTVGSIDVRRTANADVVCARSTYSSNTVSKLCLLAHRRISCWRTLTALIPRSKEIEVPIVGVNHRGLDSVRAGTLSKGRDSRAL